MAEDFVEAVRRVMMAGGFTVYRAFTPNEDDPEALVETLILSRSPEMVEAAALDVLTRGRNDAPPVAH